ncbi:hypothetical protein [Methylobacterium sp. D48H]
MAEIHILPAGFDPAVLSRSCVALQQRLEAGYDLGDRSHHIRMLGMSLRTAHRDLQLQINAIRALPPMPSIDMEAVCLSVEAWADALATCLALIETQMFNS